MTGLLPRLALLGCLLAPRAAEAGACTHELVARLPLRDDRGFLSVPAGIDHAAMRLMLDTGSDAGLITPQAARVLRLPRDGRVEVRLQGTGGGDRDVAVARVERLDLGTLTLRGVPLPVGALPAAPRLTPPVAGFLGGDVLSDFDLDIDVPHATLALWRIRARSLACAQPPYWRGGWRTVPLEAHGDRLSLAATLDGHSLRALFDTGARSRVISDAAAARVGVDARSLATEPGGIASGVDLREHVYHWHRFRSLVIGGVVERSPVLTVAPLSSHYDMLLGTDWLAHRDVWVSYATRQLFFR